MFAKNAKISIYTKILKKWNDRIEWNNPTCVALLLLYIHQEVYQSVPLQI
jgi:hypothetical protein